LSGINAVPALEPTLTIEVTYSEVMEGRLRDPVYRGLVKLGRLSHVSRRESEQAAGP